MHLPSTQFRYKTIQVQNNSGTKQFRYNTIQALYKKNEIVYLGDMKYTLLLLLSTLLKVTA